MHVVIAPQELKGSLSAVEAARAMAAGVRRADPRAGVDLAPMADGGPGTTEALVTAAGGVWQSAPSRDPLGRPLVAGFGLIDDGRTAIIEMAAAAGILRLRRDEYDPLRAGTEGVGDLVRAALDSGAEQIVIGLGGSATNDGGAGMARSLGVRFLDAEGMSLPPGGAALARLDRIDRSALEPRLGSVTVSGATDVTNPLCGPTGASAIFGPQKGATPPDVALLDAALDHYAAVVARDCGRSVRDIPGAGAAGGLGAGLLAFLGADLRSGFALVAEACRLEERIQRADLVLTGEGRLDGQSLYGKVTVGVAGLAQRGGVPCVAICGGLDDGWQRALELGLTAGFSLTPGPLSLEEAGARASDLLSATAEQVARLFLAGAIQRP